MWLLKSLKINRSVLKKKVVRNHIPAKNAEEHVKQIKTADLLTDRRHFYSFIVIIFVGKIVLLMLTEYLSDGGGCSSHWLDFQHKYSDSQH